MKKKTKTAQKLPKEGGELSGLILFILTLFLAISLIGFGVNPSAHWLGVLGYTGGWLLYACFGLSSLFVIAFMGFTSVRMMQSRSLTHLGGELICLTGILLSSGIWFSLLEAAFFPSPGPHHLGGIPLYFLTAELPTLSFLHLFSSLGALLLSTLLFAVSSLYFFHVSISDAIKWLFTSRASTPQIVIQKRLPTFTKAPIEAAPRIEVTEQLSEEPRKKIVQKPPTKREAALKAQSVHNGDFTHFQLPSLDFLTPPKKVDQSSLKKDLTNQAQVLEATLASFGIEAKVGQINCGPRITSFEVHPSVGVKVGRILALENDIALNMEATSIRIIAPIPGKAAVGVEVPNPCPQEVSFREMITTYQKGPKKFHIPILLGKAVDGESIMADLAKMPHCIIAGATGSGKSVCINTIVMSILYNARPDEIQLLMVDPKKVELTPYSRLPHMIAPVITEPQEAYTAMQWLVKEMELRYDILNKLHLRNIDTFNNRTPNKEEEEKLSVDVPAKFPYIVGIIDELADLMMVSSHDIETPIARIAQMARAVGIHLILATQRPSREVITGLIKANFPTRICFNVSSGINSKIVLDSTGAEQLLGNGDMLFLPPGSSNLLRVQGAYIRDEDIHHVIEHITNQSPPQYRIPTFNNMTDFFKEEGNTKEDNDPLYNQAYDVIIKTGNASTTFLQRKLKIGYARAASLMDELEAKGVVSAQEGSKARTVLLSPRDDL